MINKVLNYKFSIFNFQFSGKSIINNPLFTGSAIMIIGSNLSNFIAYVYHLIIGRMLGTSSYGTLAAVLSLMGLVTTTFSFLGVVVVKFVSSSEKKDIPSIYEWFTKKVYIFGAGLFVLTLVTVPFLSEFLHIKYSILLIVPAMFLFSLLLFYYRAFLQGLMRFKEVVLSNNFDMLGRLTIGALLIYFGYSVFGAVVGMAISSGITVLILRYVLREYHNRKNVIPFAGSRRIFSYTIPVIVVSIAIHSFFSNDVLLVKHFFDSNEAGLYASLSTLGKIIFYGTSPVVTVMFPMIANRHAKNQGHDKILFMSIGLTASIATAVTLIYYFLPELMIKILYGTEFLAAAPQLYLFGIFMTVFSMSSLLLNYFLSKEETRIVYLALAAAIMQAVGIWLFHNSIAQVVLVNTVTISGLFVILLIYFIYGRKKYAKEPIK